MAAAPGIVTPEAVVLEFETAGIGSRLVAGIIDLALQGVLLVAVLLGVGTLSSAGLDLGGVGAALVYVLVFLVIFGYPVAFETLWRGRTLGKAALGLRVVTVEGAPIRFRHAAVRAILSLVDWFVSQGVVGITSLLLTRRNQRLGDLVAGTIVLRERSAAKAPAPVQFHAPHGLEAYTATLGTAGLDHGDYGSIRAFLLRAATLPAAVRHDLAAQLAYPLVDRLRTTVPPGVSPETFLVCVAAAYQRRMGGAGARREPGSFSSVWAGTGQQVRWAPGGGSAERPPSTAATPAGDAGFVAPG